MRDIIILIIIIAIIYLMYQNICNNNIEKMTSEPSFREQINEEISRIYKADIQAIRNLSDISKQLQAGSLTIPGDITIEGNINMKDGKSIKSTGQLKIEPNKELYLLPKTGTVLADNIKINGEANVGTNLKVTDYIGCKRLDIKSTDGTTHFNYDNKSKNYIRGTTNQLDGTTKISNISVIQTKEYTPTEGPWASSSRYHGYAHCPSGEFITGINTKHEPNQGGGDDSGMNGLKFTCSKIV